MPPRGLATSFHELIAIPPSGTLTGNRGILNDDQGRIVRPLAHRNWATCVLEFKGHHCHMLPQYRLHTSSPWMKPRPWC